MSSSTLVRPSILAPKSTQQRVAQHVRPFSATTSMGSWLEPRMDRNKKMMKGRVRVATGGSTKGTTVIWGQYGLRMTDHGRRISATQLKVAEDTIKARLRGQKYRLYKRVNCNLGVFVSGNEVSSTPKQALSFSLASILALTRYTPADSYGQRKGLVRPLGCSSGCKPDLL